MFRVVTLATEVRIIRGTVIKTKHLYVQWQASSKKAVATAQRESLLVSDDRQRMAARLAQWLRDAGYNCEVVAALPIH